MALGVDWAADMAAAFGGDLHDATFVRHTAGAYDEDNPTGPPAIATATYACKALALSYAEEFVDGELIQRGDWKAIVLLGTVALAGTLAPGVTPNPGDSITIPPPGQSAPVTAAVVAVSSVTHASVTVQVRGGVL
jgi:hypothetical protein